MRSHLSQISDRFECDEGARLQKRDSELALKVLERFKQEGIIGYPVHDSFIVKRSDEVQAKCIMQDEFRSMFNWNINVK